MTRFLKKNDYIISKYKDKTRSPFSSSSNVGRGFAVLPFFSLDFLSFSEEPNKRDEEYGGPYRD